MMTQPTPSRILVVEDELDIRDLIVLHLKRDGYAIESVTDGEDALRRLCDSDRPPIDLVVLDWMLPGMSGLDITRALRAMERHRELPILIVTARMETADIVQGLEAGADDYVTKPFDIPVLLARVRAVRRRSKTRGEAAPGLPAQPDGAESGILEFGGIRIRPDAFEVRCQGQEVSLTPSEFKLLLALAENRGRVLTRDRLIDLVQGAGVSVVDRAIDTHVFGLRKKLGVCADVIETVRGIGYRVRAEL